MRTPPSRDRLRRRCAARASRGDVPSARETPLRTSSALRYAWLSVAAAVATGLLKGVAYWVTGSVGLLSDALESLVNVAAAGVAVFSLRVADRPPDDDHAYGHTKAEYFASGFEGGLILVAAIGIAGAATLRLLEPRPIERAALGIGIGAVAAAVNLVVAAVLMAASRRHRSIALEADAHHLRTDVLTSLLVLPGVWLAATTGLRWIDPLVAFLVALHILRIGAVLVRRSMLGLIDTALPPDTRRSIEGILARRAADGVRYHALRTRQAGVRRFVSFHILVPGEWSVQRGHDLLEEIEEEVRAAVPDTTVFTHLEPIEDPVSFSDRGLDRSRPDEGEVPGGP